MKGPQDGAKSANNPGGHSMFLYFFFLVLQTNISALALTEST